MADQGIEIVPYDPRWQAAFAGQQALLEGLLSPWLAAPPEHIGSTAVPGLAAKPIIDILAPVQSLADVQAAIPLLVEAGWLFWPDDPNRHYRLWFLRPNPSARTHHLHIIEQAHPQASALIGFRDALRRDAGKREAYAMLKISLAETYASDREAYTNAKADFVADVLRASGLEQPPSAGP